jgi:hypothetical protein
MANYLTSEDRAAYGDDLLNVSQRAAMQTVAPYLQQLSQQNAELRTRVARASRQNLDAAVERAVPNYREIDRNENWHEFLRGIDPLSGVVRQTLLNSAIDAGDTNRVVGFFRTFLAQEGQPTGASTRTSPPLGMILHRTRSSSSRGRSYTRAQIKQLYDQHRRGAYLGREAEWARQEADIFAAQRDGRFQDYDFV